MHGSGAQPVRSRRWSAAARAGRPRPRGRRVRDRARARRPRASRAQPRAHRPARRRQDGAAGRAALDGHPRRLGRGQDRGPARRRPAPPAVRRAAPGDPRPRRAPRRRRARRRGLGILKAFAQRSAPDGRQAARPLAAGHRRRRRSGRADSGDIEIDLVELFTEVAGLAADVGTGVAILIDEMQDLRPDDVSALCAACHELSQSRAPLVVVGAGLPHLPAVLSASKSYSERLFRYSRIGQLDRKDADFALLAPAEREDATFDADALDALFDASGGYPYFVQAYGKAAWDAAVRSPITRRRRQDGGAGGRGGAGRRLLRVALRAGDPGRARVPAGHGRADRGPRRAGGHLGHRRPPAAARLVALARPATACSRRGSCSPRSAARSPSRCRTSAATCSRTA